MIIGMICLLPDIEVILADEVRDSQVLFMTVVCAQFVGNKVYFYSYYYYYFIMKQSACLHRGDCLSLRPRNVKHETFISVQKGILCPAVR